MSDTKEARFILTQFQSFWTTKGGRQRGMPMVAVFILYPFYAIYSMMLPAFSLGLPYLS